MPWSRRFDDPVILPDGRELRTLRDAASHIQKLPKAEASKPHWQMATKILIETAEGRDFLMHARIAMTQAIGHGRPEPKDSSRKRAKTYRIIR
jgi:hypothetical protein